ncbi:MAG: GNAT family N-acetyltransferase, partial [Verrucomicrobiaceae bacterium]
MIQPVDLKGSFEEVSELLDQAFAPSDFESRLIRAVASRGERHQAWGIREGGTLVAFVLYTEATRGAEVIGWHLAPVAVLPDHQGMGAGSELIRRSLEMEPLVSE